MTRDYCYVRDAVQANIRAIQRGNGGVFNIGTGRETKTLELYRMIYEAVREVRPDTPASLSMPSRQPARPGDLRRSCLVVERAKNEIRWVAETDVPAGIRLTLKWWAEQKLDPKSKSLLK
jgi:UDP-glucose 4-epimerase